MTKAQALKLLRGLAEHHDTERAHSEADDVLLALIDDAAITRAFGAIKKWYA